MATEAILVDIGALYKRLFNHRPIIQNEVNFFVKEFETKREDSDLKTLQDSMSKSDEINNIFLNEIACSNPLFVKIKEKAAMIKDNCEKILDRGSQDLWVSEKDQERLDQQVKEFEAELKQKRLEAFRVSEKEVQEIKSEIEQLRESRSKQRSLTSSVGSSVTIYPAATPTTPSPENEDLRLAEGEESAAVKEEGEGEAEKGEELPSEKPSGQEVTGAPAVDEVTDQTES